MKDGLSRIAALLWPWLKPLGILPLAFISASLPTLQSVLAVFFFSRSLHSFSHCPGISAASSLYHTPLLSLLLHIPASKTTLLKRLPNACDPDLSLYAEKCRVLIAPDASGELRARRGKKRSSLQLRADYPSLRERFGSSQPTPQPPAAARRPSSL